MLWRTRKRAGQNIRRLAFRRRVNAICFFVLAGYIGISAINSENVLDFIIKHLGTSVRLQGQGHSDFLNGLRITLSAIAVLSMANGLQAWKRAAHAVQGAEAEEEIGQLLAQLEREGWRVEYGICLKNGLGDIDAVCISPKNRVFLIEIKSHGGNVITSGEQIYRSIRKRNYLFEKDFISQATASATRLREHIGSDFVIPVLVFSRARVSVPSRQLRNVHIVGKSELVPLLRSLANPPRSPALYP